VLSTESYPNWAIEVQMLNNSSGVQASKAKIMTMKTEVPLPPPCTISS